MDPEIGIEQNLTSNIERRCRPQTGPSLQPSAEPEPGISEPEPGNSEPEPGASEPEPGASEPEPGASEPEPGASEPEPGYPEPEPGAPEPEPEPGANLEFHKMDCNDIVIGSVKGKSFVFYDNIMYSAEYTPHCN